MNKQTKALYNKKVDVLIHTAHLIGVPSQLPSDVDEASFFCIRQCLINLSSAVHITKRRGKQIAVFN